MSNKTNSYELQKFREQFADSLNTKAFVPDVCHPNGQFLPAWAKPKNILMVALAVGVLNGVVLPLAKGGINSITTWNTERQENKAVESAKEAANDKVGEVEKAIADARAAVKAVTGQGAYQLNLRLRSLPMDFRQQADTMLANLRKEGQSRGITGAELDSKVQELFGRWLDQQKANAEGITRDARAAIDGAKAQNPTDSALGAVDPRAASASANQQPQQQEAAVATLKPQPTAPAAAPAKPAQKGGLTEAERQQALKLMEQ